MKNQSVSKLVFFLLVIFSWMSHPTEVKAQETAQNEVNEMPVPPGGIEGFTKYMIETLNYPTSAREAKIQGMVIVRFTVKEDGTVDAVEVLRGIGSGCDEEAVRVVKNSGKWTPGKKEGKSVATQMTLPVQFKL